MSRRLNLLRVFFTTLLMFASVQLSQAEDTNQALPGQTEETYQAPENNYAEARMIVKTLHERLLYIMQNSDSLGYQGRYDEVDESVTTQFDTALIVKVILSRYWKELVDVQKTDFIKLFQKLSSATYASRFDGFNGESFVEISMEQLKKGRLLIKTELQRPDDEPVKLDYLMHEKNGQWMIISVIANGVNDLSLKRAEYATVIKEKDFDGLVNDVANKITDLENQDEE